ncbi:MAG: hypothetical protein RL383_1479, partial [Actinomycetota bacterium]
PMALIDDTHLATSSTGGRTADSPWPPANVRLATVDEPGHGRTATRTGPAHNVRGAGSTERTDPGAAGI